jgi:hypothetical protein
MLPCAFGGTAGWPQELLGRPPVCDPGRRNMRSLAGSAFLLVVLLSASLAAGPPSGATVASERTSGRSHAQAVKVACGLVGRSYHRRHGSRLNLIGVRIPSARIARPAL